MVHVSMHVDGRIDSGYMEMDGWMDGWMDRQTDT